MASKWQGVPGVDRTERIELRLTTSEKRTCQQHAREAGMSVSEWVRHRLLLDMAKISVKATP